MLEIGVDIGGTFTDLAVYKADTGEVCFGKVLTTPRDPAEGVRNALDRSGVDVAGARAFIHGSTIAINTVIERTGAKVALITTRGFRDVLEIGRGNRPYAYEITFKRLDPLVPRELRFELTERMSGKGEVITPPRLEELDDIVPRLRAEGVEAVAICFINSYRNPSHEELVARALRECWPEGIVTASYELSREFREFERTSTVVVNAYVAPKVRRYLEGIERMLEERGSRAPFYVVESNAGITSVQKVKERPCFLMESGPVAGVMGSACLGKLLGYDNIVAFDMGGTTAKACLVVRGMPPTADEYYIGGYVRGYVLQIPVLDMVEVGAGGGSIAWVDDVGGVHVGPQSAGAEPGPACYGLGGTQPTVTDANLLLGRLNRGNFAGGQLALDTGEAERAVGRLARALGTSVQRMALGIVELANLAMAEAVRQVTIRRGLDPRDFVMVAYGGGGPLHASSIARDLSIPLVVIPPAPGNFSALGMLLMDLRRDYSEVVLGPLDLATLARMEQRLGELQARGASAIQDDEGQVESLAAQRFADMRYRGQQNTVRVALPDQLPATSETLEEVARRFHAAYELRYGHSSPGQPIEVVTVRVAVYGVRDRAQIDRIRVYDSAFEGKPSSRPVCFQNSNGWMDCPVYHRGALPPGTRIDGPAVVEERSSTILVEPGDVLEVNEYGHLLLHVGESA